jgi:2-methylisocitrate lyase-like PEP mutase family enzyme
VTTPAARYRELLREPGIVVQPSVPDALSAAIAEEVGFGALSIGGYAIGASRAMSEPLLSLEDVAQITRSIRLNTNLPIMVDAGAGWGEPLHVMHAVRSLALAGASSVHVEDQAYPKRAHYHKGVERVISLDDMVLKVRAAVAARTDPDFMICARTDSMRTDGYAEGIRRAKAYLDAGADLIMMFPNNDEETQAAPMDLPGVPLVYVNSTGNDQGRGVYPAASLQRWGWKVAYDSISVVNAMSSAVRGMLRTLKDTGGPGFDDRTIVTIRKDLERTIGLNELYAIEEQTVER